MSSFGFDSLFPITQWCSVVSTVSLEIFTIAILTFCFCTALQSEDSVFALHYYVTRSKSLILLSLSSGPSSPESWIALMLVYWWSLASYLIAKQLITALTLSILKSRLVSLLRAYRGVHTIMILVTLFWNVWIFLTWHCFVYIPTVQCQTGFSICL